MITDDDRIRIAKKAIELPNEQYNWREYLAELIMPDST